MVRSKDSRSPPLLSRSRAAAGAGGVERDGGGISRGPSGIHQLFEEQARKTPEAMALLFEAERLSYGELNRRANRLAHHLLGLGVRPDQRVAICVERSLEMVVGLAGDAESGRSLCAVGS